MIGRAFIVMCLVVTGCQQLKPVKGSLRHDTGTNVRKSWCDPKRGLPGDPSLGVLQPLRFGIGAIIREKDGTTESFVAERALAPLVKLPERQVEVSIVEHPSDADYSVMGTVDGDMQYAREGQLGAAGWTGWAVGVTGYIVGSSFLGTSLLISAVDGKDHSTLQTVGLVGLLAGVTGQIIVSRRPANHYSWDQTLNLTLRRGTVIIGELAIQDVQDRIQWKAIDRPREQTTAALWTRAAQEIATCINADLGGAAVTAQVTP